MILSPDQLKAIGKGEFERDLTLAATRKPWPKLIPYDLYGLKAIPKARKAIGDAFKEFHKYTCLRFIPRKKEIAYLEFFKGDGCSSMVGYVRGRKNIISLNSACWTKGVAIHEILHSLGFHHEQSRPDRDQYVRVIMKNVPKYAENNFVKYGKDRVDSLNSPYDFSSIMHYNATTFAKPGTNAIETIDPTKQKLIGQRIRLSKEDIFQINKLYKCGEEKWMTTPVIPTLDPNCKDTYSYCDRYKYRCNHPPTDTLTRWVVKECRHTCKLC